MLKDEEMQELKQTPGAIRSREYRQRKKQLESLRNYSARLNGGSLSLGAISMTIEDYSRREKSGSIRYPLTWGSGLRKRNNAEGPG